MRIYKDILTGDELFTDSNPVDLIDDCLYEVKCQHVTRKQGDFVLDGANPSAEGEDGDCGVDETTESGLDLVLNQKLQSTSFNKVDYKNYLKTYTKSLLEKWKELEWSEEQINESKVKLLEAVKKVMPKLGETEFYVGESCNPDGMVCLLEYRENSDGTEQPIMLFYKHGLEEEKV